jgi:carboxyl-terminal processing protease
MKKLILTIAAVFLAFVMTAEASDDEYYLKVNKSFETFGAIFKEIAFHYVEDIDPEELMQLSIEGMLGKLDPYTVYYTEEELEDLEILTFGSYTGLGISVSTRDSMLTIMDVEEGFPADAAGLRIGDRIYMIDTAKVINRSTEELRKYTRGEPGSIVDIWVIRDGLDDTLHFEVNRERISIDNVSYSGMLGGGIGYIKLERFSRKSAQEFRKALYKLQDRGDMNGLIIDVRDNPGGLLESAVSICEMFLPRGSDIVSTKGRNFHEEFTYKALTEPEEPELPLAVLINGRSASASEILAGAMQDLDRAVIAGRRSFGKGLVQSVFELPYNSNIKITTAKYYTPSGRSIQKIDFANLLRNKESHPDTAVFYTKNNRKVLEYKGIMPDTVVEEKDYPDFIIDLYSKNIFFGFANTYTSKLDSLPPDFEVDDALIARFADYMKEKDYEYDSPLEQEIAKIKELAEETDASDKVGELIVKLEESANSEEKSYLNKYHEKISEILAIEIMRRLRPYSYVISQKIQTDKTIKTAKNILLNGVFENILAGEKMLDSSEEN